MLSVMLGVTKLNIHNLAVLEEKSELKPSSPILARLREILESTVKSFPKDETDENSDLIDKIHDYACESLCVGMFVFYTPSGL